MDNKAVLLKKKLHRSQYTLIANNFYSIKMHQLLHLFDINKANEGIAKYVIKLNLELMSIFISNKVL